MCQRAREFALIVAVLWALSGAWAAPDADPGGVNPAAGSITITGRVMDSQGEPVEGARVALVQMMQAEEAFVPEPKAVDEKDTAADGTFTLVIPTQVDPQETGYVVAHKKGLALAWISWRTQGSLRLNFVLGEAKDLAGEVVEESGQPVPEAVVRVFAAVQGKRETQKFLSKPEFLLARTDETGRFLFADLPADVTVEFTVEKPGWAALSTYDRRRYMGDGYQFAPGQAGIRLVLVRGAAIAGVVVDKASGQPVGEVDVVALPASVLDRQESRRPVTTRADGTFRIESLSAGTYTVQLAAAREHKAEWTAEPVQVVLRAGDTKSDVTLQLTKGSVIEVLVTDEAGQPVPGARVNVHSIESDQGFNSTTDDRGLARMRVAPGRYILSNAYKEGYSRQISQEHITVADGETTRIEYVLNPVPKIAGIVRDESGNPLPGVKVSVIPMAMNETETDASGRFELTGSSLFPGAPGIQCMLMARDAQRDLAGTMEMEEGADDFDVTVKPAVTITGTVLNDEGNPLQGARIHVMLHGYRWTAPLGRESIAAGPDGTFEIRTIPADCQYTISATAGGYGKQATLVDASNLQGHRYDAGKLELPLANLSVTGIVVDPNDEPVAGANIRIMGDTQPDMVNMQAVHTDPEGRFTVRGLSAGSLRLIVNTRDAPHLSGSAQIEAGATDVRIIVSDRATAQRYVPRTPLALRGKPLPSLSSLGIDLPDDTEGRMLLVCFWDVGQRPSRHYATQLAVQAAKLSEKGALIVGVQAAAVESDALRQWIEENKIPFPVGLIAEDVDKTRFAWGVVALPHLILTDKKHVVIAEGFTLTDLDKQIAAAGQQR